CGAARDGARFELALAGGERVRARAVVIASGARYRRLDLPDLGEFEASCVHYWASPLEAKLCTGQEVALVGAGNSAGQAAVYLASRVAKVSLLVRGPSLGASMSRYLADRIAALPNVEVRLGTQLSALEGRAGVLDAVRWRDVRSGAETRRSIGHLFLFIGADPNTAWLSECGVALDAKGFVRTGADLGDGRRPLEASRDGVFAIGDAGPSGRSDGSRMRSRGRHPGRRPERARLRGVPRDPFPVGAPPALPDVRPRRLLRQLAAPSRDEALHATRHPIIEGYDPPEGWGWCYVDEVMLDLGDRTTPQR